MQIPLVSRPDHVPADRVFVFDMFGDDRFEEDVHESYAAALSDAPDIFWTPCNGGHWMVRRYEEIGAIVREPEIFSAREMQVPRVPNPPVQIPLNMDPPESQAYRMVLMPFFSPRAIADMEPRIRELAVEIIDAVANRGECEFMNDIASLFPVGVFMELMGMDRGRLREYRDLSDNFFKCRTQEEFDKIGGAIRDVLTELIEQKRRAPDKGLVTHLLNSKVFDRPLTDDEILRTCFLLFLGGMDTVTNVTGFTYAKFAQDSTLQARMQADPALVPKFVEEGLRMFGVSVTPRLVVKDAERFGLTFKEGEMVVCILPISGRDDRANPEPQRFNVDRDKQLHLTFSSGPHLCIGHILARTEMRILTEEWLKRVPAFSIQSGARRHYRTGYVAALENLPLRWDVKAVAA